METIRIESPRELHKAASKIVAMLADHPVVAFHGEMGAGKTTLINQIARQMEVTDQVTSPTFAIINQYATASGASIYHFDFYRIEQIGEALDVGCAEYFDSGDVCLVEWPERVESLLPESTLRVNIAVEGPSSRIITIL